MIRKLFLTFFYTGLSPKAPGTVGTIAGAILAYFILLFLNADTLFLLSLLLTIFAIKEIDIYEKQNNSHDPQEIVIDEVAGVFLALSISSATPLAFVLSVVFFRIYDIWKPSIVGYIDKNFEGGKGVMLDDILAGFVAGISSLLVIYTMSYLL